MNGQVLTAACGPSPATVEMVEFLLNKGAVVTDAALEAARASSTSDRNVILKPLLSAQAQSKKISHKFFRIMCPQQINHL
jgi:hypothetical protein